MSNVIKFLLLTLVLVTVLMGCQKTDWKEFKPSDGRFSVLMPGNPDTQTEQVNTSAGAVDLHVFTSALGNSGYIVGYGDYPASLIQTSSPASFLDGIRDGAVSSPKGKLTSERVLSSDNNPGRELKIESPDGKHIIFGRYYLVGNRLYQALAINPKEQAFGADATKFLDSFKLLAQ